jgi:hypothetical protein
MSDAFSPLNAVRCGVLIAIVATEFVLMGIGTADVRRQQCDDHSVSPRLRT